MKKAEIILRDAETKEITAAWNVDLDVIVTGLLKVPGPRQPSSVVMILGQLVEPLENALLKIIGRDFEERSQVSQPDADK